MPSKEKAEYIEITANELLEFSTQYSAAQLFKYFEVAHMDVISDAYSIAMKNRAEYSNFLEVYREVFKS